MLPTAGVVASVVVSATAPQSVPWAIDRRVLIEGTGLAGHAKAAWLDGASRGNEACA